MPSVETVNLVRFIFNMPKRLSCDPGVQSSAAKRVRLRSDATKDRFTKLPSLVYGNIFCYLSVRDRVKCQMVCRLFHVIALVGVTRFDDRKDWQSVDDPDPWEDIYNAVARSERVLIKVCRAIGRQLLHLSWSGPVPYHGLASLLRIHCPYIETFTFSRWRFPHCFWRMSVPSFYRRVERLTVDEIPAHVLCSFANLKYLNAKVVFIRTEYRTELRLRDFCNKFCASIANVQFAKALPDALLTCLVKFAHPDYQLAGLTSINLHTCSRKRWQTNRFSKLCPNIKEAYWFNVQFASPMVVQEHLRVWRNHLTCLALEDGKPLSANIDPAFGLGITLASLTQLTVLELVRCAHVFSFAFLRNLRNLKYLGVRLGCRPSESCLQYIAPGCRLRTLKLGYDHRCWEEASITAEEIYSEICSSTNEWLGSLKYLYLGQARESCKYENAMLLSYHRLNSLESLVATIDSTDEDLFEAFCNLSLIPSLRECFLIRDRVIGPMADSFSGRFWRRRKQLAAERGIEPHFIVIRTDSAFAVSSKTLNQAYEHANVAFRRRSHEQLINLWWPALRC